MEEAGALELAWGETASCLLSASSYLGEAYHLVLLPRPAAVDLDAAAVELVDVVVVAVVVAAGPVVAVAVVEVFAPVETSDQPFPGSSSLLAAAYSSASSSVAVAVVVVVAAAASFAAAAVVVAAAYPLPEDRSPSCSPS